MIGGEPEYTVEFLMRILIYFIDYTFHSGGITNHCFGTNCILFSGSFIHGWVRSDPEGRGSEQTVGERVSALLGSEGGCFLQKGLKWVV